MSHTSITQLLHRQFPTHNIVSHELLEDKIRRYCSCVNPSRWDNDKCLLKLAKIIENSYCNSDLLHEIAAKSTQYDQTKTDEAWSRCQEDSNDFSSSATIQDWAKQDNPSAYAECAKKDIDLILYFIATEGITDRKVATVFHHKYPFTWVSLDKNQVHHKNNQGTWELDDGCCFMRDVIHDCICIEIAHYCSHYQNEIKAEYTRQNYDNIKDLVTPKANVNINETIIKYIDKYLRRINKNNETYMEEACHHSDIIMILKSLYFLPSTDARSKQAHEMIDSFIDTKAVITKKIADTIDSVELYNMYKQFYNNDITKIVNMDKFKLVLQQLGINHKRARKNTLFMRIRYKTVDDISEDSTDDDDVQVQ